MNLDDVLAGGYELVLEDDFDTPTLDRSTWLPHHLPQWSSATAAAARYAIVDGCLHLRIESDQQPWCPEFDGDTRVSSLQTGVFSGPLGSPVGQHRFTPKAVVREAQQPLRLYTQQYGAFVLRARAELDADSMVALWMIGYEDVPEHSAEICVCEVFGSELTPDGARIGMGVHPFGDPQIVDDFAKVDVPLDVSDFHEYAAEWTPEQVVFHVDGEPVRNVPQSPGYPMQFMLGIYDFAPPPHDREAPDKAFVIDWFRGYRSARRGGGNRV